MSFEGSENTIIGAYAGQKNSGYRNVFIGMSSGATNGNGSGNVFIGAPAGAFNSSGSNNIAIGQLAGHATFSGSRNVAIGDSAGYNNRTSNNIFIGSKAGYKSLWGQGNIIIGNDANVSKNDLRNVVALGANALVSVSDAIVLGDTINSVKVGIGTTAPRFPLDVRGIINIRGNGTLKFSHLSNPTYRNGITDQVLTVDANGETVLATQNTGKLDAIIRRMEQLEHENAQMKRENSELRRRIEQIEKAGTVLITTK